MPEAGAIPIPKKLAAAGVTDMVRVSDARMSGTAFGTVVLHVAPEGALGPLGLVRDGDIVELDAHNRRLDLLVDERELQQRRAELAQGGPSRPSAEIAPASDQAGPSRSSAETTRWRRIQSKLITQADRGADLDPERLD